MSLLVNPLLQHEAVEGISYSGVLAEIGGNQLRWKFDEAGASDLFEASNPADADYAFIQSPDNTTTPANGWHRTSGRPVWDTYGVYLSSDSSERGRYYGAAADAVTALKAMTSGFVAAWVVPGGTTNIGSIFSLTHDSSGGKYLHLYRNDIDTLGLQIFGGGSDYYTIQKTGLTFGERIFVVIRKTAGNTWTLWINGANSGASGSAAGSGAASYWFSTVSTANLLCLGTLRQATNNFNLCDNDTIFDLAIGDTAPTDQQIADLYAAVLP